VLGIQPQQAPQTVYNLEVQGQHVFRVTSNGLLVHNSYADDIAKLAGDTAKKMFGKAPKTGGKYLFDNWHMGTFPNRLQSIKYHLAKHGKGRTLRQYTEAAQDFFQKNKHLGTKVMLKDGTAGIQIKTKIKIPGQKTQRIGGYWTHDGRLVTFWD